MTAPSRAPLIGALALRELRHDWQSAACFVAALVGVLAPLLILLALKNGVIGGMVDRLVEDPANREIVATGTGTYDAEFFADMAGRGDVGFVVPSARRINATATALRNPEAHGRLVRAVPLVPSAAGDPLLGDAAVVPGSAWLTEALAEALALEPGDRFEMLIRREIDGTEETARPEFTLIGTVSPERLAREAMFLHLDDLMAVERFRDDRRIDVQDYGTAKAALDRYASFRLYAADLADLQGLLAALEARGVTARVRAENAVLLLAFRSNLNLLYGAIAVIAAMGFWAAMAANLRGMVERRRVTFSLLRMLGLPPGRAVGLPVIQSGVLVTGGVLVTLLIVLPTLVGINATFAGPDGEPIALLGWRDVAATLGLGLITAASAAIWAAMAVRHIGTDEVLRHG